MNTRMLKVLKITEVEIQNPWIQTSGLWWGGWMCEGERATQGCLQQVQALSTLPWVDAAISRVLQLPQCSEGCLVHGWTLRAVTWDVEAHFGLGRLAARSSGASTWFHCSPSWWRPRHISSIFFLRKKKNQPTQLPLPVLKIFRSCLILRNVQQGLQKWITPSDGEIKPSSFWGKRIVSLMETQQLPTAGWGTWEEHRWGVRQASFLQIGLFSFLFFYFRRTLTLAFISFGTHGFGKQFPRQVPLSWDSINRRKEEKT